MLITLWRKVGPETIADNLGIILDTLVEVSKESRNSSSCAISPEKVSPGKACIINSEKCTEWQKLLGELCLWFDYEE